MGATPRLLRPVVGPITMLPTRYRLRKIKQSFKPLFEERMKLLKQSKEENCFSDPQDHLQMMLRYAQTERPLEFNLHDMAIRLVFANLGSFHQTSIAITNIIFNILASDSEYNTISMIRDEVSQVTGVQGQCWTKADVAKMIRTDSVMRETLRINSFGNRSVIRQVMVDSLRTEDGILLPKGALCSVLAHPAQCDEDIFPDPLKFDPFRFSRIREGASDATNATQQGGPDDKLTDKDLTLSFVSTGPQNLPFGHGRHSCPGRFLVDFELKMTIAYLLTHYDLEFPPEYYGRRPESTWVAEAILPPSWGKIRVRRKAT